MKVSQVKEAIYSTIKNNSGYFFATAFSLVVVIILSVFLDYILIGGLFLGFFFLVIPLLGCMIFSNMQFTTGKPYDLKKFYQGYKLTLLPGIHGSFRIIRSALLALLICLGAFCLICGVTSFFTPVFDGTIMELAEQINAASSQEAINEIVETFASSSSGIYYINLYSIIYLISLGFGLFFFIIFALGNVPLFYIQSGLGCSKKDAISLYKQIYPESKKLSNKMLNTICWPFYLIFPLSYAFGAWVGWTLFNNLALAIIVALFISLLLSSFLLAPYLLTQDVLYHIYAPAYKVKSKDFFELAIINLETQANLTPDQKEKLKEYYLIQLREIEELEKASTITNRTTVDIAERNADIIDDKED